MREDVWITGIGIISSIGLGREAFWSAGIEGRSGGRLLTHPLLDLGQCVTRVGAPVMGFDPVAWKIPEKDRNLLDITTQYALAATWEALTDAGFQLPVLNPKKGVYRVEGVDPERLSVCIGTGIGGLKTMVESLVTWHDTRRRSACNRYALPMLIPNAPAAQVAIRFQAQGECQAQATACAAGAMSIGDGFRLIQSGDADVVICGGAEGVLSEPETYGLMGFDLLKTMSRRNESPATASRPFDATRDGFVLSEGAGVVVLERADHARARSARAHARLLGYASTCDAHSMMQIDEAGVSIERMVRRVLSQAGVERDALGYINAHGTSTALNDRVEAQVFRRVFESHLDSLPVSSTKSMTGHAIAASGAIEVGATAMMLARGILLPTINYGQPDPACALDCIPNAAREAQVQTALSCSYGFGGHNAAVVLGRV